MKRYSTGSGGGLLRRQSPAINPFQANQQAASRNLFQANQQAASRAITQCERERQASMQQIGIMNETLKEYKMHIAQLWHIHQHDSSEVERLKSKIVELESATRSSTMSYRGISEKMNQLTAAISDYEAAIHKLHKQHLKSENDLHKYMLELHDSKTSHLKHLQDIHAFLLEHTHDQAGSTISQNNVDDLWQAISRLKSHIHKPELSKEAYENETREHLLTLLSELNKTYPWFEYERIKKALLDRQPTEIMNAVLVLILEKLGTYKNNVDQIIREFNRSFSSLMIQDIGPTSVASLIHQFTNLSKLMETLKSKTRYVHPSISNIESIHQILEEAETKIANITRSRVSSLKRYNGFYRLRYGTTRDMNALIVDIKSIINEARQKMGDIVRPNHQRDPSVRHSL